MTSPISVALTFLTSNRVKAIVIVVALVLAWSTILDEYGTEMNNDAIVQASVIYGSARVINGLVSTLQTATISPIFGSITLGETLDPINDMVERFSTVMTWSIGALFVQKILAGIVIKSVFQVVLTIVGLLTIVGGFFRRGRFLRNGWKYFLFLVFLRFAIPGMLIANGLVDQMFLQTVILENQKQIEMVGEEIEAYRQEPIFEDDEAMRVSNERIAAINAEKTLVEERLAVMRMELTDLQEADDRSFFEWIKPGTTPEIEAAETAVAALEQQQQDLGQKLEVEQEAFDCLVAKSEGKECGRIASFLSSFKAPSLPDFAAMKEKASALVDNMVTLMAALLLRCLVLPLGFLWVLKGLFRRLFTYREKAADFQEVPLPPRSA